jgi:hypothetical protein
MALALAKARRPPVQSQQLTDKKTPHKQRGFLLPSILCASQTGVPPALPAVSLGAIEALQQLNKDNKKRAVSMPSEEKLEKLLQLLIRQTTEGHVKWESSIEPKAHLIG